jgi:hypothetical protein
MLAKHQRLTQMYKYNEEFVDSFVAQINSIRRNYLIAKKFGTQIKSR